MNSLILSAAPNLAVELVGKDVLVHLPRSSEVIRLSGAAAETFLAIQAGEPVDSSDEAVQELVAAGVVRSRGLSRRGLVKAGAVGLGAGIAVIAIPSVAAASSITRFNGAYGDADGALAFWLAVNINDVVAEPLTAEPFFPSEPPSANADDVGDLTLATPPTGWGVPETFVLYTEDGPGIIWFADPDDDSATLPTGTLEGSFLWLGETFHASFVPRVFIT